MLYPLATLFCIVVTANHYFLDAVGGLVCLGIGYVLGTALDTLVARTTDRRRDASAPSDRRS